MSMPPSKPTLSIGNQLYLYRLLRDALGCGKQTLMPAVEQALSDADMAAADLGFESTREMLEQLDTCVQLTVFKGGRIYATVIAQPTWDEALAASPSKQGQQAKNVKSWKKKKRDKTLKAVKPKHVKRPEPEPEPEAEPEPEPEPEPAVVEEPAVATGDAEAVEDAAPDAAAVENDAVFDAETLVAEDAAVKAEAEVEPSSEAPAASEAPQPAISVTVVYDPEHANAGVQTIESSPVEEVVSEEEPVAEPVEEPVPVAADTAEPKPEPEPVAAPVSEPAPKPAIPDGYPVDFTTEVFCPGTLLSELSQLLPYGADAMGIVGEYYWIARENGSIDAQRNRATFALRYTRDGERREASIRIRRNTEGGLGAAWTIDHIEHM